MIVFENIVLQIDKVNLSVQLPVMYKLGQQLMFFEEKHSTNMDGDVDCVESIPYLKKGDSNIYLSQFLAKEELLPPLRTTIDRVEEEGEQRENFSHDHDQSYQLSETPHFSASAFHNFQKHLTICLKHALEIPQETQETEPINVAASKLWKAFKNSTASTKKILHFLLGEHNQHPITQAGLKECGLLRVYQAFDEDTMREARVLLAESALKQIREGRLWSYIEGKKLKDKEKFRRYVQIFVGELEGGFLRKRLPKDRVAYLLRN